MPTMGLFSFRLPADPKNPALPKLNEVLVIGDAPSGKDAKTPDVAWVAGLAMELGPIGAKLPWSSAPVALPGAPHPKRGGPAVAGVSPAGPSQTAGNASNALPMVSFSLWGHVTVWGSAWLGEIQVTVSPGLIVSVLGSISRSWTLVSPLAPSAPAVRVQLVVPLALGLCAAPAALSAASAARASEVSARYWSLARVFRSACVVVAVAVGTTESPPTMFGWIRQTNGTMVPGAAFTWKNAGGAPGVSAPEVTSLLPS